MDIFLFTIGEGYVKGKRYKSGWFLGFLIFYTTHYNIPGVYAALLC